MTPRLRSLGSIAQILSAVVFVLMSAHLARIYKAHEAASVAPTVEVSVSLESKVIVSHDVATAPFMPFAPVPDDAASPASADFVAPPQLRQPARLPLRL